MFVTCSSEWGQNFASEFTCRTPIQSIARDTPNQARGNACRLVEVMHGI
jgi:hypothetical protein